jgi:peptide/nickel transport system ATP-binding protein
LDVSVQAQILQLLKDLQQQHNLAYIFISHDMSVVSLLAHRIAVMYLGRIVEYGLTTEVLAKPKHPYTQALLDAVPQVNKKLEQVTGLIAGEVPSPASPPKGCHFHPRCKFAKPQCRKEYPASVNVSDTHSVKCVLYPPASIITQNLALDL